MPAGLNVDLGTFQSIPGLSAGALNSDLVPSTNVSQYGWLSVYVGSDTYVGALTFQCSFDESTWLTLNMCPMASASGFSLSSNGISLLSGLTNVVVGTPIWFSFFRVRMTSYTSGGATAVLHLHTNAISGLPLFNTTLNPGTASIGMINNNGKLNTAIASGHSSDTIVSADPGMLSSILVTATNTNQMNFYDDPVTSVGTIVGIVPASAAVGTIIPCMAPVITGITAKGNSANPGVTVFYA